MTLPSWARPERISRRSAWITAIGLSFCLVLVLSIRQIDEEREASGYLLRTNSWNAWQIEKELLLFLSELDKFDEHAPESPAKAKSELQLRFEIFYSRPKIALEGLGGAELRRIPGVTETLESLVATLDAIDPVVATLEPDDRASIEEIRARLGPFEERLSTLSNNSATGDAIQRLRENVRKNQTKSFWMLVLLVGSSALIMTILMLEVAHNRRLALRESRLRNSADAANLALQESERRYRHLVESTNVVPYSYDLRAGKLHYVGPQAERLFGYPLEEWFAEGFLTRHLHPEEDPAAVTSTRDAADESKDLMIEYRMVTADGRKVWVRDVMRVVCEPDGRCIGYGLLFDVTQAKQRDQELAAAQKMEAVGQLTGGLAHDFNNLLSVIIGNLELLQREVESRSQAATLTWMALDASVRGAELTRQLLGFARRQALEPKAFDLNELILDTITLMHRTLGEHLEFRTELAEDLWAVHADPVQVESAMANLAINARDAMPEGGSLTVRTANRTVEADDPAKAPDVAPGSYVMLSVSDTGTGIAPELLNRVFEPFFTTKADGKGTGLGLSMIYGFARQSGGHVELDSELGVGTTVRLYLPRAKTRPLAAAVTAPAERSEPIEDAQILVVEDNGQVRRVVVSQLADLGYRVLEAESGPAALAILRQQAPVDLLFTDIVMPGGMTGIDLAREAKGMDPALKVLFTTGFSEESYDSNGQRPALGELLPKPYRQHDLARKVQETLAVESRAP